MPSPEPASEAQFREMRALLRNIFEHALAECSIPAAFARSIHCCQQVLQIGELSYDLDVFDQVLAISIGKAGHSMAAALISVVNKPLTGIIACPDAPQSPLAGFRYFIGGHPLPNDESLLAGEAILKLVRGGSERSLLLFLISGGASAIAEKPILAGMTLDDVVQTYKALVHCGAPIAEINAIRKHLSALKGGRLAQAAAPAQQVSILVSDVPENALDALASGPTMPDTTTVADCYRIAERYRLPQALPSLVRDLFEKQDLRETPKQGDPAFARSHHFSVLSNATATQAAAEKARQAGFAVEVDSTCDDWDYRAAADHLLRRLRELRKRTKRACIVSGGEVTVSVGANSGVGGRNQQFALYCAQETAGEKIAVLSAGTDGIDGNSPAAGAVVDGSTVTRATARNLRANRALTTFDAFPLLHALGDTIVTGPTGNNVRDLRILMAY